MLESLLHQQSDIYMRARAPNPLQIANILEAHHSSVLSMAASSNPKYQVFLSFRGTDVRKNFLSHLYAALDQKGIYTFVDSEELRKGEQILPTLMRAIEESRVAIIVFSKDYASSPWCLEELAKIMECKEGKGLIVFPVFYKVEPREVKGMRGSYGTAMAKHESNFGADSEKVKRWKKALHDAGNLSGWDLNDGDEAELIQYTVKELSIHLDRTSLNVAKYPVGIDSRVQKLISLSHEEFEDNDVRMIGIWGPGGIGKTTIAKALYNTIKSQFQGCSFLAQVRETSNQSNGLVALQKTLLSEILYCKDLTFCSVDKGINLIKERLRSKKVLLVLDDVDRLDQLDKLAGDGVWFGEGSTIIVTTRNKQLLTSHGIDCVYEVNTLKDDEALDLFCRHAFSNSKKDEIRSDLIGRALHYASGLPLALEVLGSFLRGRKEPAWESTLLKLSKSPDQTINQVLKISFDGLEDNEREIFLHIACFFKKKSIEYVKEVLDSCDFDTTIGIEILIERSLIKIEDGGFLQMHDLVQLMGEDIVRRECPDDPGKRSRLWLYEDVRNVLCGNTGTDAVKAIVLNWAGYEEITLSPNAFTNMKMLRILMLPEMHLSSRGLVRLPNELRWLKWSNAPDLDFGSGPKKVVGLEIQKGRIRRLGGQIKDFRKLKSINFRNCMSLVSIPDLSLVRNLENMILDKCKSLVRVHPSVGCLDKLEVLSLQCCHNLRIFPSILKTKSLQTLNLSGCSKLEKFPDIPDLSLVPNLEQIILDGCKSLVDLPPSVGYLDKLKVLSLQRCYNLRILPSILKTKSLQTLNLSGCSKLEKFSDIHRKMEHLEELNLQGTSIKELPASIENLVFVKKIELERCKSLTRLPSSIYKLKKLESLNLRGCSKFVMFPKNLEDSTDPDGHLGFTNLNKLALDGCNLSEVEFLESFSNFPRLAYLNLSRNKFTHLPTCIDKYGDLQDLYLNNCKQLQEIPLLPSSICILRANGCKSLQKLPHLPSLSFNWLEVDLSSCHKLLCKGLHVADVWLLEKLPEMKSVYILLNGRELPKWFLQCKEEGSVSFMVPQDLYDEFLGLALCVVLGPEEGEVVDASCEVQIFVNGEKVFWHISCFYSLESDHVWLEYFPRSSLSAVAELLQNDGSHFQVCLRASIGRIKKCGFRLICRQQADDLRVVLQHRRPIETYWAFEEGDSIRWLSRKEIWRKMRKIIRWLSW